MDRRRRTRVVSCTVMREKNHLIPQNRRFLAHTINHDFYETTQEGVGQIYQSRIDGETGGCLEQQKIEALKKLQHNRIVQILGPYTLPGTLRWPLALCHLATFFEDIEKIRMQFVDQEETIPLSELWLLVERLEALLGPFPDFSPTTDHPEYLDTFEKIHSAAVARITRYYGCITSAVSYLHGQGIHYNELNPDKILLSPNGLWLTDFETISNSSKLNMRAEYIAPEVVASCPGGPPADIFSLGCIFFEMTALYAGVPLKSLSVLRTTGGFLSQANIELVDECFVHLKSSSPRLRHLLCKIKQMLDLKPENRPIAADLLLSIHTISRLEPGNTPLYGYCCASAAAAVCDHLTEIDRLKSEITVLKNLHYSQTAWEERQLKVTKELGVRESEAERERLVKEIIVLKNLAAARNCHDDVQASPMKL